MRLIIVTSFEEMHLEDEINHYVHGQSFKKRSPSQLLLACSQAILDVYSLLLALAVNCDVTEECSL